VRLHTSYSGRSTCRNGRRGNRRKIDFVTRLHVQRGARG
jgi:hypothetical protein